MKKIWKMKKSKEAVSPVIATILMVAITVVLAAVLYVMVMGFGSSPEDNPDASLISEQTAQPHQEKVTIASMSEAQAYANMRVSLIVGGTTYTGSFGAANITWDATPVMPSTLWVQWVDIGGSSDGKVSTGDYFVVYNSVSGQAMQLSLLYGSEKTQIGFDDWTSF
jgi:flagellin-like protein